MLWELSVAVGPLPAAAALRVAAIGTTGGGLLAWLAHAGSAQTKCSMIFLAGDNSFAEVLLARQQLEMHSPEQNDILIEALSTFGEMLHTGICPSCSSVINILTREYKGVALFGPVSDVQEVPTASELAPECTFQCSAWTSAVALHARTVVRGAVLSLVGCWGLAVIHDTSVLQAEELLRFGGDFTNSCGFNLIGAPVVLVRSCDENMVNLRLLSSLDWVERHPWPPPHIQVQFECGSADVRSLPWPSFTLGNCCFASQVVCWKPPWPCFSMLMRCFVRGSCGRLWKPPWPIQIRQQISKYRRDIFNVMAMVCRSFRAYTSFDPNSVIFAIWFSSHQQDAHYCHMNLMVYIPLNLLSYFSNIMILQMHSVSYMVLTLDIFRHHTVLEHQLFSPAALLGSHLISFQEIVIWDWSIWISILLTPVDLNRWCFRNSEFGARHEQLLMMWLVHFTTAIYVLPTWSLPPHNADSVMSSRCHPVQSYKLLRSALPHSMWLVQKQYHLLNSYALLDSLMGHYRIWTWAEASNNVDESSMHTRVDGILLETSATSALGFSVHSKPIQVPWDPGDIYLHLQNTVHWLEGKPILKEEGMSGIICYGPASGHGPRGLVGHVDSLHWNNTTREHREAAGRIIEESETNYFTVHLLPQIISSVPRFPLLLLLAAAAPLLSSSPSLLL